MPAPSSQSTNSTFYVTSHDVPPVTVISRVLTDDEISRLHLYFREINIILMMHASDLRTSFGKEQLEWTLHFLDQIQLRITWQEHKSQGQMYSNVIINCEQGQDKPIKTKREATKGGLNRVGVRVRCKHTNMLPWFDCDFWTLQSEERIPCDDVKFNILEARFKQQPVLKVVLEQVPTQKNATLPLYLTLQGKS